MEFSGDKETSKKDEKTSDEECRRWEELPPDILASIFLRMPLKEKSSCLPLVCKPWMEVAWAPLYWLDIDIQAWCRRSNRRVCEVNRFVNLLIRRSNLHVQRLSLYRMGDSGFFSVVNCECLKVLEIPWSRITDNLVLNHLKPLPNLRILDISYCSKIKVKGLAAFGSQCKSLVHLKRNIPPPAEVSSIDDDSEAKTIADTMPQLQRMELRFGRFGDSGLSEILTKCKALTHLDIRGCWNVKLELGDLKKRCEKLECFQIHSSDISQHYELFYSYWSYWSSKAIDPHHPIVEFEAWWNRCHRYRAQQERYRRWMFG